MCGRFVMVRYAVHVGCDACIYIDMCVRVYVSVCVFLFHAVKILAALSHTAQMSKFPRTGIIHA
jgi:hypothetical protein